MPLISEDTMRELDDILNENNPDENRLTAFLKLKTAPKQKATPQYVLGGYDVSFDLDVDLIKLPEKHQQQQAQPKENVEHLVTESQPQPEFPISPTRENLPPSRRSHSVSPAHTRRFQAPRSGGDLPEPDKLRRIALNRRSQLGGRRELQQEFDNAVNETRKISGTLDFLPTVSSTPASEKPATRQLPQQQKEPQQSPQRMPQRLPQRSPQRSSGAAAIGAALEPQPQHDHFEISFESSLKQMDRKAERPSKTTAAQRPSTNTAQSLGTPTRVGNRGTFIIETEPATSSKSPTMGQLAAKTAPSPARTDSYVVTQPRVRLRRSPQLQKVIRIAQQSDQIVSETQSQEPQVESQPQSFRVRVRRTSELLESTRMSQQVEPDPEYIVPETQPKETSSAPPTPPRSSAAAAVSCGIQTTCSADNIRDDTMLDESYAENTDSTAPLNLAPPGGNTTRLQRRRRQSSCQEATMQLLDLHRTRTHHLPQQRTQKIAQVALNKPPRPAINGEEFADELARMSNFEILDLRKRNSLGQIYQQSGEQQQQPSIMEQQLALEQSIQMEILRRNLSGQSEGLPSKVTAPSLELNALPPPAADSTGINKSAAVRRSLTMQQLNTSTLMEPPRLSRSRRRGAPVTTELLNYLELSQAIEKRLRSRSRADTKRSLYTKGNSDIEDNLSPLPPKQPKRLSDSSLQIAPAPSPHAIIQDIPIVPPPSNSIRYSRQSRRSVRFSSIDVNEEPPVENQVQLETDAAPDQTQSSPVGIIEEILIVPSPPASLRYSRQSRRSVRFSSIDVNEEPPKENQVQQGEGVVEEIPIVPSPPSSLRYSRQCQRYMPEPPDEFLCAEAEVQQTPDAATELEDVPIRPPSVAAKRSSRRSVRLNSIAVDAEPREEINYAEEEQVEELTGSSQPKIIEDIQIVPPAPAAIRYTRQSRRSLLQPSQEEQEQQQEQEQVEQGTDAQGAAAEEENLMLPVQLNNNTEASSTCMEELRMETPTPPAAPEASDLDLIPLDEQPSTSRAAREALQLSIQEESQKRNKSKDTRKQQKPKKQKKPMEDDALFKKPSAPPPRNNRKNPLDSALEKLRITLVNETLPEDANATIENDETTGVRRSKRGHVPLRNTWVHTVSNPFKFTFFERSLSTYTKFSNDKSKARSAQNRTNSLITRPPLGSSTPRDDRKLGTTERRSGTLKRKRYQQQELLDAGLSQLPEITEEEDQQMESERSDVRQSKRKAETKPCGHPHKRSNDVSETESEADPMPRTEEFYAADEPEPEPEPRAAPDRAPGPILNAAQNQLLQMTDWLRGVSDAAPESTEAVASVASEEENNLMRYTSAANLEFTNLDGIEYTFFGTEDKCAMGYMRFQPLQQRGMKRNKSNTLRFLALYGEFEVELDNGSAEMQRCILKTGDLVEIKMGSRFNIINRLNEISLLIVNRK